MRSILVILLLSVLASPALAQLYSEIDLMGDQVRVTGNNMEFSPRLTVGFENEDVGTRLRYWHLDADINLSAAAPGYIDDRFHFDVVDWDVYKQFSGLRFFGGLRAGYLNFGSTSSPAVNAGAIVPGQVIPYYRVAEGDYNGNSLNYAYDFYYPAYYSPDHTSVGSDSIKSAIFGPTVGLEGDVPIIANLWVDYGARMSLLLANWYTRDSYVNTSYYYGIVAASQGSGARFADTLFVPEIYTGLELRWTHVELGAKFEVQKWQSDQENYSFQSPTIVGIGGLSITHKFSHRSDLASRLSFAMRASVARCRQLAWRVGAMEGWVERELDGCEFPDQRLKSRLGKVLSQLGHRIGETLPGACQDWAATKAAYRFFSNPRVNERIILAGHFAATAARMAATKGTILVLHDTTEFSYQRDRPEAIGKTRLLPSGRLGAKPITKCGLLLHSSLAITTTGKPLGLTAVKFWTRKKFKGTNALKGRGVEGGKHSVNATRIPIEQKESIRWLENLKQSTQLANPDRCIHIGDRESDIYELFCLAKEEQTHFLVRTCVDRLAGTGSTTIARKMKREPIQGTHQVEVLDAQRRPIKVELQLRYSQMTVHPPIGKHKKYPPLSLTVIHAWERGKLQGRKPICWKLLTDLPVENLESAIEKVDWYSQRWKIETFYKVLKSGCRAEDAKLRTAERLTNLIAVFCVVAWRVFWLTMVNRTNPKTLADAVFTETEIAILNHLTGDPQQPAPKNVAHYVLAVAKLGGYLNRKNDGPPGNTVLWRGLTRLTDIHLGVEIGRGSG